MPTHACFHSISPFSFYEIIPMIPVAKQLLEGMVVHWSDLDFIRYDDHASFLSAVGMITGSFLQKVAISKQKIASSMWTVLPDGNCELWNVCNQAKSRKTQNIVVNSESKYEDQKNYHYQLMRPGIIRRYSQADSGFRHTPSSRTQRVHGISCYDWLWCQGPRTTSTHRTKSFKEEIDFASGEESFGYSTLTMGPVHYFLPKFSFRRNYASTACPTSPSDAIARWYDPGLQRICA